ncbi:hypothetical protein EJ06DRAFT_481950 [Trichodelitschia bisporula]|uniref:Membrane-associated proteins in eicosanoid and glutathione metabolism n=1 Tax=Trichodelitschia bisporula TaxID=703511 RepID=A0A6G1HNN4_9PEZI|nr:hypothetical protein EJ06DRAFT_481950 [Trichodelitschia bisporula]
MTTIRPFLPTTGAWAFPFTAYYILLSFRTAYQRRKYYVIAGNRVSASPAYAGAFPNLADDPLHTAVRAEANYMDNIPLALILAALAEANGAEKRTLGWAMGALLAFRVAHAELGLFWKGRAGLGRIVGYYGTVGWMLGVAGWGWNLLMS